MSIWCSYRSIGDPDDVEPGEEPSGVVRSYATGWSNHYPTTDGTVEQPACIGVASIPTWCVPGHEEELDDTFGPWLRLDVWGKGHDFASGGKPTGEVQQASVVLDENAVRSLLADLTSWLAAPKVYPWPTLGANSD